MKIRRRYIQLAVPLLALVIGCGGGTPNRSNVLQRPVDLAASAVDIAFDGRVTRFVYVATEEGGSIVVIDQDKERIIDTDKGDDFDDSSVPVGGSLIGLELFDRSPGPRIFLADQQHGELFAFDTIPPSDPGSNELLHEAVDLGEITVGRASQPLLVDKGRLSTPVISELTVNPETAQMEQWEVKFKGDDKGYEVTGSKSGKQSTRVLENESYTSDRGEISFRISSGGERTTDDDLFRFGTVVTKPLRIERIPSGLELVGDQLYIVTSSPPGVLVFDIPTSTITAEVELDDGSGTPVRPGKTVVDAGILYIPNRAASNLFLLTLADLTLEIMETGISNTTGVGIDSGRQRLYLTLDGVRSIVPWELTTLTSLDPIRLSDFGLSFVPYEFNGVDLALIPTTAGAIEILDRETRTRIDTRERSGDTESDASSGEFFDVPPTSKPELLDVSTNDDRTPTEEWSLLFEGVVRGGSGLQGTVTDTLYTVPGATFLADAIAVGDHLILNPLTTKEEIEITEVLDEENLRLGTRPEVQEGASGEIRAIESYVAIGSLSGDQKGRVTEGIPYASDEGVIALTIRPSVTEPTTRDDFFSFVTIDGVDPIQVSDGRLAQEAVVFIRPGKTEPTAYVVQMGTNAVTALDLKNERERKSIR